MSFFEPPPPRPDVPEPAFERKPWWGAAVEEATVGIRASGSGLPPPGPVAFVVDWPSEGIELTRHEVNAAPILEAGRSSTRLWPEPESPDGGAWTTREQFGG